MIYEALVQDSNNFICVNDCSFSFSLLLLLLDRLLPSAEQREGTWKDWCWLVEGRLLIQLMI